MANADETHKKIDRLGDTVRDGFTEQNKKFDRVFSTQAKHFERLGRMDEKLKASGEIEAVKDKLEAERKEINTEREKQQTEGIQAAIALAGKANNRIDPIEKVSGRAVKIFWGVLLLSVGFLIWAIKTIIGELL